jgi:nucleotide-binding universal stress UspA family protein
MNLEQGHSPSESTSDSQRRLKPERLALKLQQILVPTDFSDQSKKALKYAVSIAERLGAKITLLHVVEVPATSYPYAGYPFDPEPDGPDEFLPWVKVAAYQMCKEENIDPQLIRETVVEIGVPYREIADTAEALKINLIVIATRGRSGFAHASLRSTTERLVRHAPCPVLVVREKEQEFASA